MKYPPFSSPVLHFFQVSIFFVVKFADPLSQISSSYSDCSSFFQCGIFTNISYPFWGGSRAKACGHPELALNCNSDITTIQILDVNYHVLDINPNTHMLKIARQDLKDGICSSQILSTSINPELFEYGDGYKNLTLLYGCQPFPFPAPGEFSCPGGHVTGYLRLGDVVDSTACQKRMVIPVRSDLAVNPWNVSEVEEAIREGVEVKLKVDPRICIDCIKSNGVCGFDLVDNQQTCFCRNETSNHLSGQCSPPPPPPPPPSTASTAAKNLSLAWKMNSMILSHSLFLFLLLNLPPFSSSFDLYSTCSKNFSCGHVVPNAGFPFWGGDRPQACGYPALKLTCENDLFPMMEIDRAKYLVLNLDESSQTLRISRTDFLNGVCSTGSANSTFDSKLFDLVPAYDKYLFMYKCDSLADATRQGNFTCDEDEEGYYALFGAELENIECGRSLIVYFSLSSTTDSTNITAIEADVKKGFQLKWKVNDENCRNCTGVCGYDSSLNGAICYPPPVAAGVPSAPSEKKNQLPLKIGMGAGGAAVLCLFLGCVFYVAKRRKEHKMQEKHVSLPHLSNDVSKPNTSLSLSIPSFPYSKSDLENGSTNYGVQVFNYMELEEATRNFDPSRELGEGGFGTVYYGKLSDGREVAVKRLYENNLRRVEQFKNELEILTRLHHPNLVRLYGSTSRRSQELLLVYEYIPNGTVADHLHGKQPHSKLLDWHLRLRIALETADALAYLHHSDIIHRDVKTNNILLDDNFRVKVADFGLSRLFPTNVTHVSTAPQGTPGYVDPEYYQVYQLTDKSDVFSFGVVLIELISSLEAVDVSRHRHDINLSNMALNKIQRGALHELVDPNLGFETDFCVRRMITSVSELAFRCLQQDKEMRPPMDEVLEILQGIENEESGTRQAEVVDISRDDVRLLKNMPPPLSPDSVMTDKLVSTTTTDASF